MQDAGTVYFNESADEARRLVKECLEQFDGTLEACDGKQRESLRQTMGLKLQQLRAEVEELNHMHDD